MADDFDCFRSALSHAVTLLHIMSPMVFTREVTSGEQLHPTRLVKALQQQLRRIEAKLDNPRTGLAEIKSEVAVVEGSSPTRVSVSSG